MEAVTDDVRSETGDAEDLPSDFFDDFNKDEFMAGLSVIDECGDDNIGVKDYDKDNCRETSRAGRDRLQKSFSSKSPDLDNFIKPGSRRDLNKTNEAIKKDKEVKVLEYLAKSLTASDDLHPPGTELDHYYENKRKKDMKQSKEMDDLSLKLRRRNMKEHSIQQSQHSTRPHHSPVTHHSSRMRSNNGSSHSPQLRRSPQSHRSPRVKHSPHRNFHRSHNVRSPLPSREYHSNRHHYNQRRSPLHRSPPRNNSSRRSPRRHSPNRRSPHRQRSRSPHRPLSPMRRYSRSPHRDDQFLYPDNTNIMPNYQPNPSYQIEYGLQCASQISTQCPVGIPGYNYSQVSACDFSGTYNYSDLVAPQPNMPAPEIQPAIVPAPSTSLAVKATPYDALAQLVAEGKISKEDYLKLTPNKGVVTVMDPTTRSTVLSRCHQAISKLDTLLLPNRLTINNEVGSEEKMLAPKYCSPLKRQIITEFSFSKEPISQEQQTKRLVDGIIATLGLEKIASNYKKKLGKNMKDALVQTTKSQCEVCHIRASTKYHDVGTSTEPEYFTSTVHTQVVEEDLASSRAIFNPSGSFGEGAAISIAHLTPAQLVSQLAARAKTLKQPQDHHSSNQFTRRPNYDYDDRGGQQYHHSYNNYRY